MLQAKQTLRARKPQQLDMLPKSQNAYGGTLRSSRKGRGARAISTKHSMHTVLRSSLAIKDWSFRRHDKAIKEILTKFASKYGVRIISVANAGNHLHMQLQFAVRSTYKAFMRAITGAIAMAVTGASRWRPLKKHFWDYRPFTRIVIGFKAFLSLKDYIQINKLEGYGYDRSQARFLIEWKRHGHTAPPKVMTT
jgi:putative transposase